MTDGKSDSAPGGPQGHAVINDDARQPLQKGLSLSLLSGWRQLTDVWHYVFMPRHVLRMMRPVTGPVGVR